MDSRTYDVWNKIKTIANNGTGMYHCADMNDKRRINELVNAGCITVSWKTALDAVFHTSVETE